MQVPGTPAPQPGRFIEMETFNPYQDPTLSPSAALYGGADWCPWDPDGNYLCVCISS